MGFNFHETAYGRRFFESQLPKLTKSIDRLAEAVEGKKTMSVYMCYEENSAALVTEAGAVNNTYATTDIGKVKEWLDLALLQAKNDGFQPATDVVQDISSMLSQLEKIGEPIFLDVYRNGNPNHGDYFIITVKKYEEEQQK